MILALKLLLAPLLIYVVTLAGRRWGPTVSGFLIGLPLVSGPISFILAYEYGLEFASRSAVGNLAGQISNCVFALTYIAVARRGNWPVCSVAAIASFFGSTFFLNLFTWQLWPTLAALIGTILLSTRLTPHYQTSGLALKPPRWDLPGRIVTATGLVLILTTTADSLGPQLSGLISPFPAFSVIFAAFTHAQLGAKSASNLLRGVIVGSGGYATFFVIVGALLPRLGLVTTYLLATAGAIGIGSTVFFSTQKKRSAK